MTTVLTCGCLCVFLKKRKTGTPCGTPCTPKPPRRPLTSAAVAELRSTLEAAVVATNQPTPSVRAKQKAQETWRFLRPSPSPLFISPCLSAPWTERTASPRLSSHALLLHLRRSLFTSRFAQNGLDLELVFVSVLPALFWPRSPLALDR